MKKVFDTILEWTITTIVFSISMIGLIGIIACEETTDLYRHLTKQN